VYFNLRPNGQSTSEAYVLDLLPEVKAQAGPSKELNAKEIPYTAIKGLV
jgi:hypothetical protein